MLHILFGAYFYIKIKQKCKMGTEYMNAYGRKRVKN